MQGLENTTQPAAEGWRWKWCFSSIRCVPCIPFLCYIVPSLMLYAVCWFILVHCIPYQFGVKPLFRGFLGISPRIPWYSRYRYCHSVPNTGDQRKNQNPIICFVVYADNAKFCSATVGPFVLKHQQNEYVLPRLPFRKLHNFNKQTIRSVGNSVCFSCPLQ